MKLPFSLFCKLSIQRSENKIAQAFKSLFSFKVCVLFHVLNRHIWGFARLVKTVGSRCLQLSASHVIIAQQSNESHYHYTAPWFLVCLVRVTLCDLK